MKIQFLGGANEVGRLGMLLKEDNTRLLFDYGISPTDPPKYPIKAPLIDFAFLSHAHLDHSGMIPWISGQYEVPVYTTHPTNIISQMLAEDSLKICKNEGYPMPFRNHDIKAMKNNINEINYEKIMDIGGLEIHFHSAGHIPGSTMFELRGEKNILFTGDINTINTNLVWGTHPIKCDTLIIESTYSGREHPERNQLEKEFLDSIDDIVNRGGVAIIPSFAVGRTQEILILLKDTGYNIWLDGMGKTVTKHYLDMDEYLRSGKNLTRAFNQVNVVHSQHGRKLAMKGEVIVTTSGMLDGGPVITYLNMMKSNPKNAVLLTGYQVEGTNGRKLMDSGMIEISGANEKINCQVKFFDFSAHAGHKELLKFIQDCKPENVILCHGDNREIIANELQNDYNVILPENNEVIEEI